MGVSGTSAHSRRRSTPGASLVSPPVYGLTTPDWIEVGVAIGTAGLAVATFVMAWATKRMAEAAEAELEHSRRQTAALEAAADQGERTLAATGRPILMLLRASGNYAVVNADASGNFSVMARNEGPVMATIREGELRFSRPRMQLPLGAEPGAAVDPGKEVLLTATVPADRMAVILEGSVPVPIRLGYKGPSGSGQITRVTLLAKNGDDLRWLIIEPEQHIPWD
jgi:hypothetical protein